MGAARASEGDNRSGESTLNTLINLGKRSTFEEDS